MFAVGIAALGALVLGVGLALMLRRVVFAEAAVEEDLHRAGAHTLVYEVPVGEDPAVPRAALTHAGFECASELRAGGPVLLVLCESDAARDTASRLLQQMH
jgi:hypothetical protein